MVTTYTYTTVGEHSVTISSSAGHIIVKVWGAAGGASPNTANSQPGGYVEGRYDVSGGETLYARVGGRGSDAQSSGSGNTNNQAGGYNGGGSGGQGDSASFSVSGAGGGGASDVRYQGNTTSDRIAVGGGAGGAAGGEFDPENGGQGGPDIGEDGNSQSGGIAQGGSQSSGGSGGDGGGNGSLATGGDGENAATTADSAKGGGGGGGGYYGGGGGGGGEGGDNTEGSGAGGSNYDDPLTNVTNSRGVSASNAGDGKVVIEVYESPPAAPNISSSVTADDVTLSWTDVSGEDGYRIYRAQASQTADPVNYTQIADIAANSTSYTDTALEDGERFYYRVSSYNSAGESLSNEVNEITALPAPSGVSLDTSIEDEITVSWTKADDSPDGEFEVFRSQDGTLGTKVGDAITTTTTSITDTGLEDGEQYYYTVRRVTDHTSSDSGQVSGVTVLPGPSGTTVSEP